MGLEPDHFANQMAAMPAAPPSDSSSCSSSEEEEEERKIYNASSDVNKDVSAEKGSEVHKEDISEMFGQSSGINSENSLPPSNVEGSSSPTLPGAVGEPNAEEPKPPTGPKSAVVQPVSGAVGAPSPEGRARRRTSISHGVSKVAGAVMKVTKLQAVVRILGMAKRMKDERADEVPEMEEAGAADKPKLGEKGKSRRIQMKQQGSEKVSERRRTQ